MGASHGSNTWVRATALAVTRSACQGTGRGATPFHPHVRQSQIVHHVLQEPRTPFQGFQADHAQVGPGDRPYQPWQAGPTADIDNRRGFG